MGEGEEACSRDMCKVRVCASFRVETVVKEIRFVVRGPGKAIRSYRGCRLSHAA